MEPFDELTDSFLDDLHTPQKRSRHIVSFRNGMLAGILIVLLVVSIFSIIIKQQKTITTITDTPIVVEQITPTIILDILSTENNGIDELSTLEYRFTDSAQFKDSRQIKNWKIPLTEKSFTLKWDGVIKVGINISDIKTTVKGDTITITIPTTQIFSYDIDEDSVELLDEKNNIFNPITIEDKLKFDKSTEKEMKERAIENCILEKAQQNAKSVIYEFLLSNSVIRKNYDIQFILE